MDEKKKSRGREKDQDEMGIEYSRGHAVARVKLWRTSFHVVWMFDITMRE